MNYYHIIKLTIKRQTFMKRQTLICKPIKHRSKSTLPSTNIFFQDQVNTITDQPNHNPYHFIGSKEMREKILRTTTTFINETPLEKKVQMNETGFSNKLGMNQTNKVNEMNSTINRDTILSKLSQERVIEATKQSRNLLYHKEYRELWQKQNSHLKRITGKNVLKHPTLIELNTKALYAQPNAHKIDVINQNIVHFWEMSLRNHHHILKRHIKGANFQDLHREELLQLKKGTDLIEKSIPDLPLKKLEQIRDHRAFSLSGRNSTHRNAINHSERNSARYSNLSSVRTSVEEVYKIDYAGDKKWLGNENFV